MIIEILFKYTNLTKDILQKEQLIDLLNQIEKDKYYICKSNLNSNK
jgi:hypothetical protein